MCLDIIFFYLMAALEYFKYMKIPPALFPSPSWIVEQYDLAKHQKDGWLYLEMRQAVWGLPQAGILANKKLRRKLAPFRYYECVETPGLWKHESWPLTFTLVVDDFRVKYESKDDVDHLIASIKSTYKLTKNWMGNLYCGISLNWDYINQTVDISLPGCIKKNCRNTTTCSQGTCRRAHTHQNPRNLGRRRKHLWRSILPCCLMRRVSNEYRKL